MKTIEDYDDYLTAEIKDFDRAAEFAQKKGLLRYGVYAAGSRDAVTMARSVLRTTLLPGRVEGGEVLMAYIARKSAAKKHNVSLEIKK